MRFCQVWSSPEPTVFRLMGRSPTAAYAAQGPIGGYRRVEGVCEAPQDEDGL